MKRLLAIAALLALSTTAQAQTKICSGEPVVSRTSTVKIHEGSIGDCIFDEPEIARIEKVCRIGYPNSNDETTPLV